MAEMPMARQRSQFGRRDLLLGLLLGLSLANLGQEFRLDRVLRVVGVDFDDDLLPGLTGEALL